MRSRSNWLVRNDLSLETPTPPTVGNPRYTREQHSHFFVRNTGEEVGAQSRQMSYSASLHYTTKTGTNMKEHHFDAWSLFSVLSSTWIINRSNRMSCTTYLQPVYPGPMILALLRLLDRPTLPRRVTGFVEYLDFMVIRNRGHDPLPWWFHGGQLRHEDGRNRWPVAAFRWTAQQWPSESAPLPWQLGASYSRGVAVVNST